MWATMKYVSETWIVSGTMASITPEMPPRVNIVRKLSTNSIGVSMCRRPRHSVASHEKILIPVGTAMIAVVTIIGMRIQLCMPETNMWWAQTGKPSSTMASREKAIMRWAKVGFLDFMERISDTIPKPGNIMM